MKNKHIIISGIALFLITITLLGLTYAYYKTKIVENSKEKSVSVVSKNLEITYNDGTGIIEGTEIEPGYTVTKTFSVKNTGDDTATYSIKLDNIINTFTRTEDWTYVLKEGTTEINKGTIPTYETTLLDSIEIESGVTKSYSLVVTYANLSDVDQSIDMGSTLSIRINIADAVKNSVTFIGNGNALENYRVYGNSIQRGIPTPDNPVEIESVGDKTKNLFDLEEIFKDIATYENGYYKFDVAKSYILYKNGIDFLTFKENTQYTFKIKGYVKYKSSDKSSNWRIVFVYADGTKSYKPLNYTTETEITYTSKFGATVNKVAIEYGYEGTVYISQIQLEEGPTATEYEPYGYKIPVTVSGKNLLNSSITEKTLNGVTLKNENGKITLNGTCTESANFDMNYINLPEGTYTLKANASGVPVNNYNALVQIWDKENDLSFWISNKNALLSTTKTVKISGKFLYRIRIEKGVTYDNLTLYPQLENGNTATEYEPYVEPITTNIYLDEPLRKIGNYADYIDFKEKKVVRNIGKSILTGYEIWTQEARGDVYTVFSRKKLGKENAICSHYQLGTNIASPENSFIGRANNKAISFYDAVNGNTVDSWKSFLIGNNNNPLYVEYELEIPTEETKNLPTINALNGTNVLTVNTNVGVSNIEINK